MDAGRGIPSIEMQSFAQKSGKSLRDPLLENSSDSSHVRWVTEKPISHEWPSPVSLRNSASALWLRLLPNFVLLLIPVGFFVLFVFILTQNGHLERDNSRGEVVMQVIKIASTLWPIFFAAVIGPMLKTAALYHAERGTKLGTLEVLTTSQTLISALRGCFDLRIFSMWSAFLILVWALSPVGGQAVLRSMETTVHEASQTYPLRFYPSNNIVANTGSSSMTGGSSAASVKGKMRRAVEASLSTPDVAVLLSKGTSPNFDEAVERLGGEEQAAQSAQTDLWGNVRIPFLHLMPGYNNSQTDQWIDISSTLVAPYSSLMGHTIRGIPESSVGNISLQVETAYHTLSCTPWFNGTEWLVENPSRLRLYQWKNNTLSRNVTTTSELGGNIIVDILTPTTTPTTWPTTMPSDANIEKSVLVFGSKHYSNSLNMTLCETSASFVETDVKCVRTSQGGSLSCAAARIRQSPGLPASNWTALNGGGAAYVPNVLDMMPDTLSSSHVGEPSGLELYLRDPPTSFKDNYDLQNFGELPMDVFQARLALVFNTFYHASLNQTNFFGADGVGLYDVASYMETQYGNATGTWTELTPSKYEVQPVWLILYLVATAVLAICAVATIYLSALIRTPDLFGGVSSLTRDSAYVTGIPDGGSALSGTERARLLQDVWVRIQDVKPDDEMGRIAFSDQEELKARGGLRWERKYE